MNPLEILKERAMGMMTIQYDDLEFTWSRGTRQRAIKPDHIENLVSTFLAQGVQYEDPRHAILVLAHGTTLRNWIRSRPEENNVNNPRSIPSIGGYFEETGKKLEVQTGMHRLKAFRELRSRDEVCTEMDAQTTSAWLNVPWVANVFDLENMSVEEHLAVERLRMNTEVVARPDGDGELWVKSIDLENWAKREGCDLEQAKKICCGYAKQRWVKLYRSHWKDDITELMAYPAYQLTFNSSCFDTLLRRPRIHFYWKRILSLMKRTAAETSAGNPSALDPCSLSSLQSLRLPRRIEATRKLFYPVNGPQTRNDNLLVGLDDGAYEKCFHFLTQNPDTPLLDWRSVRGDLEFADTLEHICTHISRWIDPTSMMEKTFAPKKTVDEIWNENLQSSGRVDAEGMMQFVVDGVSRQTESDEVLQSFQEELISLVKSKKAPLIESSPDTLKLSRNEYLGRFSASRAWCDIAIKSLQVFGEFSHPNMRRLNPEFFEKLLSRPPEHSQAALSIVVEAAAQAACKAASDLMPTPRETDMMELKESLPQILRPWLQMRCQQWLDNAPSLDNAGDFPVDRKTAKTFPKGVTAIEDAIERVTETLKSLE